MATNYTRAARTDTHKAHGRVMARGKFTKGSGTSAVSHPQKSDTQETSLETEALVVDLTSHDPNEPVRVARSAPWGKADTIVSARSKRELRQLIQSQALGAGHQVISNIQINDQGLYFVYTNAGGGA